MTVTRFDTAPLPRVRRTAEGYLRGEAVVTRTGVFRYINADGTERRELRHPDDILQEDSLGSMKMIPVTIDHPREIVGSGNAASLQVGMTGETVRADGSQIVASLTITSAAGIAAVQRGDQQLSLGYHLDLEEEAGTYEGEAYTHRQRNVRYNHLALVRKARAGDAARLNLDGAAILSKESEMTDKTMARVAIRGLHYDAEPEVERHLVDLNTQITRMDGEAATAAAALTKATAERDEHKARADKAEADLAEARSDAAIEKRVAARLALDGKAKALFPAIKLDGKSTQAVMIEALAHVHKGLNLDGKSTDYIEARFDAAVEARAKAAPGADALAPRYDGVTHNDAEAEGAAWQRANADLNAWRNQ